MVCIVYDVCMLIRTQILFPKDDLEELKEIARERGISVSELVRTEVRKKVLKPERKKKMGGAEVLVEMARRAYKGKVPKDLGSNDEYLYGKLAPDYPLRKKKK